MQAIRFQGGFAKSDTGGEVNTRETHTSMNKQGRTGGGGRLVPVVAVEALRIKAPFYGYVPAGFPSPADDYLEEELDLGEYLVRNPAATFFIRVTGRSMTGAGIYPNDILIVDRSLDARHGDVIIAVLNTEFTVKRLYHRAGTLRLVPDNPDYEPILIREGDQFQVWGVVAHVIHKPTRK